MKKGISKSICALLAAVMLVMLFQFPQTKVKADYMTMRDITAYDLVSEMNVGISIGNSFDAACGKNQNETAWGNPRITRNLIKAYKQAGFNTIRLPITWRGNMDSNGNPNTAWLDRVQEVTDMILDEGLYCIINTHHEQNWLNTNNNGMAERKVKFANLWTAVAERFKYYGDHLLFEGFNEILKAEGDWSSASDQDYENANILSQVFVDTVRSTGANNKYRVLVISTYGAIHETYGFKLPKDTIEDRLAVEFHCYYPQEFCFTWGKQKTWGSSSDNNTVKEYCSKFYNAFVSKKIPVILGEFGAVNKENYGDRVSYATTVAIYCKQYGIKAIWWDNGTLTGTSPDSFALINRSTCANEFVGIVHALVSNSEATPPADYPTIVTDKDYVPSTSTTKRITTTRPTTRPVVPTTSTEPTKPIVIGKVTNISAKLVSANSVKLSWQPVSNASDYEIYKLSSSGMMEYYNSVSTPAFYDYSLSRGKAYSYQVVAVKHTEMNHYYGAYSDIITIKTFAAKMTKVSKASVGKKYIKLKYSKVNGANGYEVKYSTKKSLKGAKKKNVTSLKPKITKLKKNKKYYFSVRAYKVISGKKVYTTAKKVTIKTKK